VLNNTTERQVSKRAAEIITILKENARKRQQDKPRDADYIMSYGHIGQRETLHFLGGMFKRNVASVLRPLEY
jgi:hypothetical protein